ncbi:FK506 binding protein [Mycena polygramma]|nr:FK506 binding protein [Mycena polygramma]
MGRDDDDRERIIFTVISTPPNANPEWKPKAEDKVQIHYVGTLENGSKFDSSRDRGDPFTTVIGTGQVIRGWDLRVPDLLLGQKARLEIPPDLGYGTRGFPPVIPPNSKLIFEVELLKINGQSLEDKLR